LITCVDNLTGFSQAISACYPQTEIQKCIIHQIRNSTRYVTYKDLMKVPADLKPIYKVQSGDGGGGLVELVRFEELWGTKYPLMVQSWRSTGKSYPPSPSIPLRFAS
jgi:transposase-like protein